MLGADADDEPVAIRARAPAVGERQQRTGRKLRRGAAAGQFAGQEVHRRRADEAGDIGVGRALEHLHRRGELRRPALVQHQQAVAQRHRLHLVVRHEQAGDAQAAAAAGGSPRASSARSLASRLDSGSSNRNSFGWRTIARPIATRCRCPPESCRGLRAEQRAETEQRRRLVDTAADVVARQAADAQAVRHVVEHAHVRIERVVLEHHGDVAFRRVEIGHVAPIDQRRGPRSAAPARRPGAAGSICRSPRRRRSPASRRRRAPGRCRAARRPGRSSCAGRGVPASPWPPDCHRGGGAGNLRQVTPRVGEVNLSYATCPVTMLRI